MLWMAVGLLCDCCAVAVRLPYRCLTAALPLSQGSFFAIFMLFRAIQLAMSGTKLNAHVLELSNTCELRKSFAKEGEFKLDSLVRGSLQEFFDVSVSLYKFLLERA